MKPQTMEKIKPPMTDQMGHKPTHKIKEDLLGSIMAPMVQGPVHWLEKENFHFLPSVKKTAAQPLSSSEVIKADLH